MSLATFGFDRSVGTNSTSRLIDWNRRRRLVTLDGQSASRPMALSAFQYLCGLGSGALVGLTLGLVGGGGSILATPLMVYVVGVRDPHLAIGTSAFAVAANAFVNLLNHARSGRVKWRCAGLFAAAGVVGALAGSTVGKLIDGRRLLFLFALLMLAIGVLMLRRKSVAGDPAVRLSRRNAPKILAAGVSTGALSGFFGIGGGFLIVPALMASTGMPILEAVCSSLIAVTAFGLTTALNYALSGWVDWALAAVFLAGGVGGGLVGAGAAKRLAGRKGALASVFASLIFAVAIYMLYRTAG
jgi:uncharacterized protein